MKKLWILKRESNVYEHDVVEAMVVRASNSLMARELSKSKSQDEGAACWTNRMVTTCEELTGAGLSEVILIQSKDG